MTTSAQCTRDDKTNTQMPFVVPDFQILKLAHIHQFDVALEIKTAISDNGCSQLGPSNSKNKEPGLSSVFQEMMCLSMIKFQVPFFLAEPTMA